MSARDALDRALLDLAAEGERPRCCWPDVGPWFTSEDATERARAARRCHGCPVFTECGQTAEEERPTFGVWAGVDYGVRPATKKTTKKESKA